MRALAVMAALTTFTSCWSEDWVVRDLRGVGSVLFFSRTINFDGQSLTQINGWPLSESGVTRINVSSGLPDIELRDVTVIAWTDVDGTRECERDCSPQPEDRVVTLTGRNWPWVYEIEFTNP